MPNAGAPTCDDRRIWDLWLSAVHQPAIVVAAEVGVFDALADEPSTITALASRLGFDERATGILLRLLTALGLLTLRLDRFHVSSEASLYLRSSSPWYWGPMLAVGVSEWHRDTLIAKLKRLGSDRIAAPEGTPLPSGDGRAADTWAAGTVTLGEARDIAARMHSHSVSAAAGVARCYDFHSVSRVLDVGGGSGCFMTAVAHAHPHLRCTVMELPAMCQVAREYIAAANVGDRVDTLAIDMFRQSWPSGYDALFFSNIWHDWNLRTCEWLAAQAFASLPSGGRILLHEMLLNDDGAGPLTAASFSLLMLLATQGQQFTAGELKSILVGAGFVGVRTTATHPYYAIVDGRKP